LATTRRRSKRSWDVFKRRSRGVPEGVEPLLGEDEERSENGKIVSMNIAHPPKIVLPHCAS
jgi:hypothetical protein